MPDSSALHEWVAAQKQKGFSDEYIRTTALSAGWPEDALASELPNLVVLQTPPPPPEPRVLPKRLLFGINKMQPRKAHLMLNLFLVLLGLVLLANFISGLHTMRSTNDAGGAFGLFILIVISVFIVLVGFLLLIVNRSIISYIILLFGNAIQVMLIPNSSGVGGSSKLAELLGYGLWVLVFILVFAVAIFSGEVARGKQKLPQNNL